MNIIDLFLQHAQRSPDKTAIEFGDQSLSYRDVAQRTATLCATLRDMGVTRGDRILIALENGIEFSLSMLAAAELGAMIAPLSTSTPGDALARALSITGACFAIATRPVCSRLGELGEHAPDVLLVGKPLEGHRHFPESASGNCGYVLGSAKVDASSAYLLTMTSGSTGDPKPITLTQEGKIRRSVDGARDLYNLSDTDVVITATPMYHSLGFRLALLPLLIGATAVILHNFTPNGWIDTVQRHAVSFAIMVSSHLELLCRELSERPRAMPSLRTIVSSSALLRPETKRACLALFACEFHECYGASEVGIATNLAPTDCRENLHSVGKALDYVELRIVNDRNEPCPAGTVGEITCRTTTLFSGYYQQAEATRCSIRDGFFHTGDMGSLDADGYLTLAGRKKDIIIVGGTNVYPEDIETVLKSAPGVRECAVIGVPDAHFGEATLALIVAESDHVDARKLRLYCAERLADFQTPLAFEQVATLPRTALGKIQRQRLRDQFEGYDATVDLRRMLAMRAGMAR